MSSASRVFPPKYVNGATLILMPLPAWTAVSRSQPAPELHARLTLDRTGRGRAARRLGVELRTDCAVARIDVRAGRVHDAVLADSILNRIVSAAELVQLDGPNMRRHTSTTSAAAELTS